MEPPIAPDVYPVSFRVEYPDRELDRLSTGLRIIWAIPIMVVLSLVSSGAWNFSGDARGVTAGAGGLLFLAPLLMIVFRQKYRAGGSTGTWNYSGSRAG